MAGKIQRLDKLISNSFDYSRSQVKELIKKKKVLVNDNIVLSPELKVNPDSDKIVVDGQNLNYTEFVYYMLNKPAGVVSATNDNTCKTVLELIETPAKSGLFPVGRLDKDTEGLLIITNDGELSHSLLSPKKHVDKTYYVETDAIITDEMADKLTKGLDIGDEKPTLPAKIEIIKVNKSNTNRAYLTITEGRFHQVKRMFKAVGPTVTFLKRISMSRLMLDENLKPGEYRELTDEELGLLKGE